MGLVRTKKDGREAAAAMTINQGLKRFREKNLLVLHEIIATNQTLTVFVNKTNGKHCVPSRWSGITTTDDEFAIDRKTNPINSSLHELNELFLQATTVTRKLTLFITQNERGSKNPSKHFVFLFLNLQ